RYYADRGLDTIAARRAAEERFWNVAHIGELLRAHDERVVRTQNRRDLMDDLLLDLRYAFRSLRRAPAFAIVAILTLGLGVGANTAVFSVVDAVLLRALPYPRPAELVAVPGNTLAEFSRVRDLNTSFSDVAAYMVLSVGVSGDAEPERVDASSVSANLLSMLGVRPELGRTFATDENTPGHARVAVLSHGLWTRRFAGNREIVGQSIVIEGAPYTIVGVMPRDFAFPNRDVQLWTPFETPPSGSGAFWGSGGYRVVARLRAGVSRDAAQHELRTLYPRIGRENPIWSPGPQYGTDVTVAPLQQKIAGSAGTMLWLLLGVVGIVLLIACANVANLLLVRATSRQREIAVRMALGGGRGRLVRQLLTESFVLATLGGIVGVAFAWWGVRVIGSLLPEDLARTATLEIDARVLAFTGLLVVATGIVFGLVPALRSSRGGASSLRDGARSSTGGSNRRLASALVSAQIAAAAVLVVAAMLLVQSVAALERTDPGFRTTSLVTARVSPPAAQYAKPGAIGAFTDEVLRRARAMPGVDAVAAVNQVPLDEKNFGIALRIEGQFEDLRGSVPMSDHYQVVSTDYFATLGIPLTAGREFSSTDRSGGLEVAMVNESFARHFWPGQSALGKRIGYPWPSDWITIVGVVRDTKTDSLTGAAGEAFYRPLSQAQPRTLSFVVRTSVDAAAIGAALRTIVAQVDARAPVSKIATMRELVDRSASRQRFATLLLALFATIAVALGVVGIYGVMSYAVAQRTSEIGIRMALGAAPADALRLVLAEGMRLAAYGLVAGIIAATVSTRALSGLLYGVGARDPLTFVGVPIGLAAIALLATYVPARRATAVDPTRALRAD
ncbi:MAG: ABC transporter permease, partial [Gemmatimonadaceae bacterium]